MADTKLENPFSYRIIKTKEEINEITELITRVYTRQGYLDPDNIDDETPKISSYLSSPYATVFGAYVNDTAVGTITVIEDTNQGLPMDVVFKEELNEKRDVHTKIAEVCQFAIDKQLLKQANAGISPTITDVEVSTHLLRLVVHYGIHRQFDFFSLAINPKHKIFYKAIGCIQIGTEKQYPSVNNAPALGYILDIKKIERLVGVKTQNIWLLREIIENPPNYALFENAQLSPVKYR